MWVDDVFALVLVSHVTGEGEGLVGVVLEVFRDVLEVEVVVVFVHSVVSNGEVTASGEEVLSTFHFGFALLVKGVVAEELTAFRALLQVSVEVNLGGIFERFSELEVSVDLGSWLSLHGGSRVGQWNIGHLSGGVESALLFLVVGSVVVSVEEETRFLSNWAAGEGKGANVVGFLLSKELGREVEGVDEGTVDSGVGFADEFVQSFFAVGLVVRGDGIVGVGVSALVVGLFLSGVFGGVVEGEFGGLVVRSRWVEVEVEVVLLDFLFSPWVEEEGDEVVALEVVVESSEIEVLVVSLVVGTEVESEFVISKGLVVFVLVVVGLDLLHVLVELDRSEVEDAVESGVGVGAVVEDSLFVLVVQWLDDDFSLGVVNIEVDVELKGEVEVDVLVNSGNVALVVEWSNESELGFQLGGVSDIDGSGDIDGFRDTELVVVSLESLDLSLNFSSEVEESWELDGVGEGKTGGGWESNGKSEVVVELGVVEGVSVGGLVKSTFQISGDLVEDFFVDEGVLLGS